MHDEVLTMDSHAAHSDAIDVFGFWLYIMTDCILFGCLFAVFIVLTHLGMSHIALKSYIDLDDVLLETLILLGSNFTFCLSMLSLYQNKIRHVQFWLAITFLLGVSFIFLEVSEFVRLAHNGFRWDVSATASAFFTLVGTHGLHVSFGLLWILIMIIQLPLFKITHVTKRRMTYLGLFWNFLDIVWIFVFTIVYLMGAI